MFTNPDQNILYLGLKEGMRVADFGAGSGFYSKAASARVGYSGKVYAIEVQKEFVKKLESDLKSWGISNVDCIWGDIEKKNGTKISDHSIDAVIVSNVLFQAEDKLGLIDEVKRVLKNGGEVLLIDWSDSANIMAPKKDHLVSSFVAKELFEKRGFKFVRDIPINEHHYGIIFNI